MTADAAGSGGSFDNAAPVHYQTAGWETAVH